METIIKLKDTYGVSKFFERVCFCGTKSHTSTDFGLNIKVDVAFSQINCEYCDLTKEEIEQRLNDAKIPFYYVSVFS